MAYRRDDMWSDERYEYERLPRERLPPRPEGMQYTFGSINPQDPYRVVNFAPKKLTERPGEYRFDYGHSHHIGYRDYGEGRGLAHERRSGPPHRIDDPGYRWSREDQLSRPPDYREIRDGIRRKPVFPSHYPRDRSPHKRDSPYFRESPVARRDSPPSRSGSSVSSRGYSPDRSKAYAFHQAQLSRSMPPLHKSNISQQDKERPATQSLKTSGDVSPSGTTAVPPSKALDKSGRLSEKELAETASRWPADKPEKGDTSSVPEISEYEAEASEPLYAERHEATVADITDDNELFEDTQRVRRAKAIAAKTAEIEKVYKQDCETFGAVVKMLIEKDPSLEKSIQFSLRQNLHEIGERCIEELKHFITEYDARSQEFEEP
nr:periphilin-1 isoform X1 [Anolis sagrei ordinatus]XP_060633571.1 periphilin-1 isoform X1 [Anolis sagrei ordinatus]